MDNANSRWTPPTDEYGRRGTEVSSLGRFKVRQNSIKEGRGCPHWELTTGPRILGVGGRTHYQETIALMRQVSPDGEQGRICPLVAENLADNLLGQHLLTQMEVILMTNYQAFFDTSWKRGIGRKGNIEGESLLGNTGSYYLLG